MFTRSPYSFGAYMQFECHDDVGPAEIGNPGSVLRFGVDVNSGGQMDRSAFPDPQGSDIYRNLSKVQGV